MAYSPECEMLIVYPLNIGLPLLYFISIPDQFLFSILLHLNIDYLAANIPASVSLVLDFDSA